MLTIRHRQCIAMQEAALAAMAPRLCADLRAAWPERLRDVPEPVLADHVHAAVQRARSYGLRDAGDLRCWLDFACCHGWDVELQPAHDWMRALLTDLRISAPADRLNLVIDRHAARAAVQLDNARRLAAFRAGAMS
jgi:hypothetical protein